MKSRYPRHTRSSRHAIARNSALAVTLIAALGASAQDAPTTIRDLNVPQLDVGETQLGSRQQQQLATTGAFDVRYDFQFTDRQPESGITFEHHFVDDGGKEYKMVHYDHGNGMAAADVDGDRLVDLYFTNQTGANQLWKNLGEGRFRDITESAGVAVGDRITMSASFADIDNDGDADLFVTTVKMGNLLFENLGEGRFRDISANSGLDYVGHSSSGVFFDYDNDGLLDLFVTNVGVFTTDEMGDGYYIGMEDAFQGHLKPERTEQSLLYRNLGERRFQDVSAETGLVDTSWAGDAAFADLNGDGYQDLYVLNMQGDDHYYQNVGGQRFVDRTAELFPKTPWGAMGVKFFDYNNDTRPDLMLTDMHSDMGMEVEPAIEKFKSVNTWTERFLQDSSNNVFGNAFFRNLGGRFEEVSDLLGTENYWPWGFSVGDLNADGWEDIFITASMSYPFRYGINSVLLNNNGEGFLDSEFILGVEPRREGRTRRPWFVIDCTDADAEHPLCTDRDGRWQVTGTLGTRSSVLIDLDADGDQDIVTLEFSAEPQVLMSDLAQRGPVRFIEIDLEGIRSNRNGFGAVLRVHAGDRVLTRFQDGKSGYLAQSDMPLYVGLGDATAVDRIEVQWPSGTLQTIDSGIGLNELIHIREPE